MKKLLMLLIFSIMLISIGISGHNVETNNKTYEIYIPSNSYSEDTKHVKIVKTGAFDILKVDDEYYEDVRAKIDNALGEAVLFEGNEVDVYNIINKLNIRVVSRDEIDGKNIIYGYSEKLKNNIKHKGKIVNIQLNFGNNMVEIGTPLIMGSY